MADQIIIELIGDPSGLKPAEEALKELSKISEENMEAFTKANEALAKFNASTTAGVYASKGFADSTREAGKAIESVVESANKGIKAISDLNAAIAAGTLKEVTSDMSKASKSTEDLGAKVEQLTKKKSNLDKQLKENRTNMDAMKASGEKASIGYKTLITNAESLGGKISSNNQALSKAETAFKEHAAAAEKAGKSNNELAGEIGKVGDAADKSKGKFKVLDVSISDSDKTTLGLLGHTKDMTHALGKVGEAMAAAAGNEDMAAEIKKKTAVAIQAISTAQAVATAATEAATVATLLLDGALTPIIVVAAAVALGVAAMAAQFYIVYTAGKALLEGINQYVPVFKIFGEGVTAVTNLIHKWGDALRDIASKYTNGLIDNAQLHKHKEFLEGFVKDGQKHNEVLKNQIDLLEAQGAPADKIREAKQHQLLTDEKILLREKELATLNHDSVKLAEIEKKLNEDNLGLIRLQTEATKEKNAAAEEAKKQREREAEARKAAYAKRLDDEKATADAVLAISKGCGKEELDAKIKDLNAAAAVEINNAKGNAKLIQAIKEKLLQDTQAANNAYMTARIQAEKKDLEVQIELAEKGSQQEYDLKVKLAVKEREIAYTQADLSANERLLIEKQFNDKIAALNDAAAASKKKIDDKAIVTEKETAKQSEKLDDETTKHKEANAKKLHDDEKKMAQEAIKLGKEVADAIFTAQAEKRKAALDDTISTLEKQKEKELSNSKLTAAQKKAIEEKFRKEEAAAKLKAWKAEQKAKEGQAIINGALAILNIIATMPDVDFGVSQGIAIGLAVATTAIQVAQIATQQPPKFAKGVIALNGPGTETSDSIAAYLSKGESVITAERTRQYKPILEQIQAGIYQPLPMPLLSTFPRLNDIGSLAGSSFDRGPLIDYDKLGRAVAQALPKGKTQQLSFDKKGFSHYLLSESGKIESYNNRYKE